MNAPDKLQQLLTPLRELGIARISLLSQQPVETTP